MAFAHDWNALMRWTFDVSQRFFAFSFLGSFIKTCQYRLSVSCERVQAENWKPEVYSLQQNYWQINYGDEDRDVKGRTGVGEGFEGVYKNLTPRFTPLTCSLPSIFSNCESILWNHLVSCLCMLTTNRTIMSFSHFMPTNHKLRRQLQLNPQPQTTPETRCKSEKRNQWAFCIIYDF